MPTLYFCQKLVTETFEGMWFTPLDETNIVAIRQRVDNIVGIVAACKQSFISDWMEQLVFNVCTIFLYGMYC